MSEQCRQPLRPDGKGAGKETPHSPPPSSTSCWGLSLAEPNREAGNKGAIDAQFIEVSLPGAQSMKEGREWDWKGQHVQQLPGGLSFIPQSSQQGSSRSGAPLPTARLGGKWTLAWRGEGAWVFSSLSLPLLWLLVLDSFLSWHLRWLQGLSTREQCQPLSQCFSHTRKHYTSPKHTHSHAPVGHGL